MEKLNMFDSFEYLEPKCPGCRVVLDYGVNTKFNETEEAHVCDCGHVLK